MKKINTQQYTCLEVFARQTAEGGRICVLTGNADGSLTTAEKPAGRNHFAWLKMPLQPDTDYEIRCKDCEVTLCYLSGGNMLETGVRYLEKDEADGSFCEVDEAVWYDRPDRET